MTFLSCSFPNHERALLWDLRFSGVTVSQTTGPLKMGSTGCPKTSVNNNQYTPRNIPEERRSNLHRGRSLNSNITFVAMRSFHSSLACASLKVSLAIFIIIIIIITAAFKAYCAIWVRRSNYRHQASPRVVITREHPAAEGWNFGREMSGNFA